MAFVHRICGTFLLFFGLIANPALAESKQRQVKVQKTSLTRDQEIALGERTAVEVEQQIEVIHNPQVEKWLNAIGQRLAATPQANAYPYYFKLVNDQNINAFALPGGPMYVNTGLITAADNEAQMAGVLAHEMSHVALRHGASQVARSGTLKTVLGIATVAAGVVGGDLAGQAVGAGGGLGAKSMLSKYSRDSERDADLNGARMMASAGYDPAELARFFVKLNEEVGSEGRPQGLERWMADHPDTLKRAEYIREDIRFYSDSQRKPDTGDFTEIQFLVVKIPAPRKPPVIEPPAGFRTLSMHDYGLAYPQAWAAGQDKSGSIYVFPEGGLRRNQGGELELLTGAMIDDSRTGPIDLTSATGEFIKTLKDRDANLEAGTSEPSKLGGQMALKTRMNTRSSLQKDGNRVVYLYTVALPTGLWSLALAAPASAMDEATPVFHQILDSVQFAK